MLFALVCAGSLLISGQTGAWVMVAGYGNNNHAELIYPGDVKIPNEASGWPETYSEGQYQVMLSRDRKTAWINTDTDDVPGRGVKLACKERAWRTR